MVLVEEAEKIIQAHTGGYGVETVPLEEATGRILAGPILADRDMPPFNRATMDGIAIGYRAYQAGIRRFRIKDIQAAGDEPLPIGLPDECVEIMTGSALSDSADTVIPYEELSIEAGQAQLRSGAQPKQNVHPKGKDKKQSDLLVPANTTINAAVIAVAASTGNSRLTVKKLPRVVIISTGNELVEIDSTPSPFQIRCSNNYMIRSVLERDRLFADMIHIPDDREMIERQLSDCLQAYDVVLLSGGVSMGKFDFIPSALKTLEVEELFYKVQQRPGKPLWFGRRAGNGTLVFAFPGNPVSTFLCLHRYFLPWLHASLGIQQTQPLHAALESDLDFPPPLQYFVQVSWRIDERGQSLARPQEGNGSGDFSNLLQGNAFLELPAAKANFKKGELFRLWPFAPLF